MEVIQNINIIQDIMGRYGRLEHPLFFIEGRYQFCQLEHEMLKAFNFTDKFIHLIMSCVTTPAYTLAINGSLEGFFYGKKGLRQGDTLSPFLFVLCMEDSY